MGSQHTALPIPVGLGLRQQDPTSGIKLLFVGKSEPFFPSAFPIDLLGLLKWRSNTSLLHQNLKQLMKVDGGEVVKVEEIRWIRLDQETH
ncbi:hypothetical protein DV515_00007474 [Chloebia gouldiae]|uniref:Uncharacterized protein n=1 Tax=Chloebia gouldiae TaxID=44316 RepID=A0A3L8SIG1_CHLGU|nr:hypothetical protein DV515_00007474 [Chloebia gouldiae]